MKVTIVSAVWCNACLVMKKIYNEIEKEYPNFEYTRYDYDIDEDEVKVLNVGEVLPVMIINNGNEEKRVVGEKSKDEIINILKEMVK